MAEFNHSIHTTLLIIFQWHVSFSSLIKNSTMGNDKNMPELDQVQTVISSLRKPEVRTGFTELLLTQAQQYFNEMISQPNPPAVIQQFKERQGLLFLTGSALRGTARPGSSDLDIFVLYDDPEGKLDFRSAEGIVTSSQNYHPERVSFPVWLARKCKANPEWKTYYNERIKYAQANRSPTDDTIIIEKYFIQMDALEINTHELSQDIRDGERIMSEEWKLDVAEKLIPQILTSTTDFSIQTASDGLLRHQRKIVEALAQLEESKPAIFSDLYGRLSSAFRQAVLYLGGSHGVGSAYYQQLLKMYVEQSGRFPGKTERATRLLRSIKEQIHFPAFEAFKKKYLGSGSPLNQLTNRVRRS